MDGDRLGRLMSQPSKQMATAAALATFAKHVRPVVEDDHNGFLVYNGGDDVLAVLPIEDALPCATILRDKYVKAFAAEEDVDSTISAGILYAHVKTPLTRVLREAHELLDGTAKRRTGRDAIAVSVWKSGGPVLTWTMPWESTLDDTGRCKIHEIAEGLSGEHPKASHSFFHRIRETFELLSPPSSTSGQRPLTTERDAIDLLAADYLASLRGQGASPLPTLDGVRRWLAPLLQQCQTTRTEPNSGEVVTDNCWAADAVLFARFLAQKGLE